MPAAFQPFQLKDITLRNRIAVPPMCQYSATDGFTNEWHWAHYAGLARGGAGLVIVEATAVSPEGRITPGCTGLWQNDHVEGMSRVARSIKAAGSVPGIQIGHAGRKASANLPWQGDDHIPEGDARGWDTISSSSIAFGGGLPKLPREMTLADIDRVKADFVSAAKRALQAGFEWLELHFAHGYLAQSFFSVHANKREDGYGGDAKGRSRFILETFAAVREIWPENLPLTARFGVVEFDGRDDKNFEEAVALAQSLRDNGLDLMNVSMGFSTTEATVPWGPSFLVPVVERFKRATNMPVASAWCVDAPQDIEMAIADGKLDVVMVGRAMLADPHYTYQVAKALGQDQPAWTLPAPYAHWLSRYRGAGKGAAQ